MAERIAPGVVELDTLLGGWERVTAGYLVEGAGARAGGDREPVVRARPAGRARRSRGWTPPTWPAWPSPTSTSTTPAGWATWPGPSPTATVYVHEKGARHLADPSRLVASAAMVYGDLLDSLYGRLDPTPAERIHVLEDGEEIDIGGGRRLTTVDSPGHAKHHLALHDSDSGILFAGDAVGVRLPDAGVLRPSTPPPDFDLDQALTSLRRFAERRPSGMALAHYGLVPDPLATARRGGRDAAAVGRGGRGRPGAKAVTSPPPSTPPSPASWRPPTPPTARSWRPSTASTRTPPGSAAGSRPGDRPPGPRWGSTTPADAPRLRVRPTGGPPVEVVPSGPGSIATGDVEVTVAEAADGWTWSVANRGDEPLPLDAVALVWDVGPAGDEPGLLRNGYQSWSPCGVVRLGDDEDPSRAPGSIELARALHHADAAVAPPGELRSELVTVVDRGTGDPLLCAGFVSGTEHDGTFRARLDDGGVTLAAEAFLGGAVLAPGEVRTLHDLRLAEGDPGTGPELLEAWAAAAGREGRARTQAPYTVGWCSWYQYFAAVTEADVRANLARAADWPFDVFQLDDGYQQAIGDWLLPNERFPGGLEALAADVDRSGRTPGIWLAPFVAAPGSAVLADHPDWIAAHASGRPLVGVVNEAWGGPVLVLDTTRPEVLAHLEATAAALVALGYRYLKLDFTYAPAVPGRYADPSRTPAQRVRAGMEAVRRGAGDDVFLLGCGLPLAAGIGVVDGMRIGPDVAPWWEPGPDVLPGYAEAAPATVNAWRSTLVRSAFHRRLWLNDPDCLMLRTADTGLSAEAVRAWALAVGVSGGMALVSDDLALLDAGARRLLDEVLVLGHRADAEARTGPPPRCGDLMDMATPGWLSAAGYELVGDPDQALARVSDRRR